MRTKLICALCFFLMISHVGFTQFKKGTRMVGPTIISAVYNSGTSDFSYPSPTTGYTTKTTSYNFSIQPSVGWFFSGNTAVGGTLTINPSGSKTSFESGGTTYQRDKISNFNIGAGAFIRNYFSSSNFMPFGQAGFNLGISSFNSDGFYFASDAIGSYKATTDGKSSGGFFANASASLGLTRLLNPHTGIDFFAGYIYSYTKNDFKLATRIDYGNDGSIEGGNDKNETRKFTNHGFQVGIGFQVFLDPK